MIAAIYARKSTDLHLPDAEKSVTRQVEHGTAYAARRGWAVDPALAVVAVEVRQRIQHGPQEVSVDHQALPSGQAATVDA